MNMLMLSGALYTLFSQIMEMSVKAGVVILFVLAARLMLKKAPKIFSYTLWAVVLFRLLCPVTISSEYSLLGWLDIPAIQMDESAKSVSQAAAGENEAELDFLGESSQPGSGEGVESGNLSSEGDWLTGGDLPSEGELLTGGNLILDDRFDAQGNLSSDEAAGQEGNLMSEGISDRESESASKGNTSSIGSWQNAIPQSVLDVLIVAWLAGASVLLVCHIISFFRIRIHLREAARLRENIYLADHISSPFVLGLVRPKIYLPSAINVHEQEYIILHEQHHIRRGDHVIKVLAFLALCIHWFNPLVWAAFILAGRDMEMSCDEAVIRKMGADIRADYSASLLSLATGRTIIAGMPLAFGEGDTSERIKNLSHWKKPGTWIMVLAAVFCAITAAALFTDPAQAGALAEPFEHIWQVDKVIYVNPHITLNDISENQVLYSFGKDSQIEMDKVLDEMESDYRDKMGNLEEITLTKKKFDRFFLTYDGDSEGWIGGKNLAASLRKNNAKTWRVKEARDTGFSPEHPFYYLMQQKNGDIYLVYGSYDPQGENDSFADDSCIRWVAKLEMNTMMLSALGEAGEETLRQVINSSDTDYVYSGYVYGQQTYSDWKTAAVEQLSPGQTAISVETIEVTEDGAQLEYNVAWTRAGLTLEVGLLARDGTEYLHKYMGGFMSGGFMDIPAGSYQLFVRNSEDNLRYAETTTETLDISPVILKYQLSGGEETVVRELPEMMGEGAWVLNEFTADIPELTAGRIWSCWMESGQLAYYCDTAEVQEFHDYLQQLENAGFEKNIYLEQWIKADYVCYRAELSDGEREIMLEYRGDGSLDLKICFVDDGNAILSDETNSEFVQIMEEALAAKKHRSEQWQGRELSEWFGAYNGEQLQVIEKGYSGSGISGFDGIVYYRAEEGESLDDAVIKLLSAAMETLKKESEDREFVVTDYEFPAQNLHSWDTAVLDTARECWKAYCADGSGTVADMEEYISQWLEGQVFSGVYAVPDDMWYFIPEGKYRYEGTDGFSFSQLQSMTQTTGEDMAPLFYQGDMEAQWTFLVMKYGDIYRMQKITKLTVE